MSVLLPFSFLYSELDEINLNIERHISTQHKEEKPLFKYHEFITRNDKS